MCVVSMVTDHYNDRWRERLPYWPEGGVWPGQQTTPTVPFWPGNGTGTVPKLPPLPQQPQFDPIDVDKLRQMFGTPQPAITQEEVAELRALLARAREYDARNHEPACEMREKQEALIAVAKALGVTITIEELNA